MRFAGFACLIVVLGSAYWTLADDNERPGRRGADRQELLKRFDKNGDGRLDEEERIAARRQRAKKGKGRFAEVLKRFDKDGDGKLNDEERAQARRAREQGNSQRAGAGRRRPEQPRLNAQNLLRRFDKDGDKKLNREELSALLQSLRRQRTDASRQGAGRGGQKKGRGDQPRGRGDRNRGESRRRPARVDREKLIDRFDKDGDGRLNEEERAAAREALRQRRGKKADD